MTIERKNLLAGPAEPGKQEREMQKKITLRNEFHGTKATVIVRDGYISAGSMRRALKKLCGMNDCCCGVIYGPQDAEIIQHQDGGAEVVER